MRQPPLRPFAAGLVQLEHAVRLRPAEVERDAPPRDDRPEAVVHHRAAALGPRLKPRCSQPRRKLPDCDTPRAMLCVTRPAIGLGVPSSSALAVRKNVAASRHAAKPMPSTYGSAAVYTTWYRRVRS
jgi:hypothetical protein